MQEPFSEYGRDTMSWLCLCIKEQVYESMKLFMCHFEQGWRRTFVQKSTRKTVFHNVS